VTVAEPPKLWLMNRWVAVSLAYTQFEKAVLGTYLIIVT